VKAALKKLRAWLRRPFAQVMLLIILVGAAGGATERFGEYWRDGEVFSGGGLLALAWCAVVLTLLFKQADRIEARMKAGDRP
jgi:hypothetical protein